MDYFEIVFLMLFCYAHFHFFNQNENHLTKNFEIFGLDFVFYKIILTFQKNKRKDQKIYNSSEHIQKSSLKNDKILYFT